MNKKIQLGLMLMALALGGCGLFGSKNKSAGGAAAGTQEDTNSTAGYNNGSNPAPVQIGGGETSRSPGLGGDSGAGNVVYFEFDSTELTDSGRAVVSAAAQYLSANPSTRVRLEGHADERGTREYNVGLGERRADAVMQALVNAGASGSQLSVLSYGEERPASPGHDESAWALNRRVEIVK